MRTTEGHYRFPSAHWKHVGCLMNVLGAGIWFFTSAAWCRWTISRCGAVGVRHPRRKMDNDGFVSVQSSSRRGKISSVVSKCPKVTAEVKIRIFTSCQAFLGTRSSFFTSKTPETPFAAMNASWLSFSSATTPFSVTRPLLTMMWIGGMD